MENKKLLKRGIASTGAALLLVAFGCERPNPYKLQGAGYAGTDCPPVDISSGSNQTSGGNPTGGNPTGGNSTGQGGSSGSSGSGASSAGTELDERTLDYSEALRTASLKLIGNLPTLSEVYELHDQTEADKPTAYADMIDAMMADPRFAHQMVRFYRQTLKISEELNENSVMPNRDTAPNLAARVVVEEQPWSNIFTATENTCPSFDPATGTFSDGTCSNQQSLTNEGLTPVGLLTDPALMAVYWGSLAFRRSRTFHEAFLCRSGLAPGGAEPTGSPSTVGACGDAAPSNYTSPWPIDSIAGSCSTPAGGVDFHAYNATVVCANCHSTWNHRSPLWGHFDEDGLYVADAALTDSDCDDVTDCSLGIQYAVRVPIDGEPFALLSDWLSETEAALSKPYAWRYSADDSMRAATLAELGQVMANDDEVLQCAVKRAWNWAMSRGDIVEHEATVPSAVVEDLLTSFKNNNLNMKALLREIFLHDDFVRF